MPFLRCFLFIVLVLGSSPCFAISSEFSFPLVVEMYKHGEDVELDQVSGSYTGVGYHFHRPRIAISSALWIGRNSVGGDPHQLGEPVITEESFDNSNEFELDDPGVRAQIERSLREETRQCYQTPRVSPVEVSSNPEALCFDSYFGETYKVAPFTIRYRTFKNYLVGVLVFEESMTVDLRGAGTQFVEAGQISTAFVYVMPLLF